MANLLTAADSSFEDGTVGAWTSTGATLANIATWAMDGTKSLEITYTGSNKLLARSITALTSNDVEYMAYAWLYNAAVDAKSCRFHLWGNSSLYHTGSTVIINPGETKLITITGTFTGDTTRVLYINNQSTAGIIYADGIWLCATAVAAPTVSAITPTSGTNDGPVSVTNLAGTGFLPGATVKLTKTGQSDIAATSVTVVSATQITCTLPITSAAAGTWNVVVTNTDTQTGTGTDLFTVTAAGTPLTIAVTPVTLAIIPKTPGVIAGTGLTVAVPLASLAVTAKTPVVTTTAGEFGAGTIDSLIDAMLDDMLDA